MKIVLATQNRDKIKEITSILGDIDWQIVPMSELDPAFEIIENGVTFVENAKKKAETVMKKFGYITLGEDTGLEVDVLNGRPGIYSARYTGINATYEMNRIKLLKELNNVPNEKRTARFRCTCALAFPKNFKRKTKIFEGICEGYITTKPSGLSGFGYDPIFVPIGYNKTFAELSFEEKNKISHRGKALKKIKEFLKKIVPKEGVEPS